MLALLAAGGLPADWTQTWLTLEPLPGEVAPVPVGAAKALIEALLLATDVVLLMPAQADALQQHSRLLAHLRGWQALTLLNYRDWMRGKRFALVATLPSPDAADAIDLAPDVRALPAHWQALCAELDCEWHGALLGQPDATGNILTDVAAGFAAQGFLARSAARPLAAAQDQTARMQYLAACARACACAR
ncbi:hypothetical protein IP84_04685 [beta proteobacterium AAP99]|nr:hypothetical protein IP84_04685 [beta proteobacterium AAP99]